MTRATLEHVRALATLAFVRAGCSEANARITAEALVAADADGLSSHGLSRLAAYADQVKTGKVDGEAVPSIEWTARAVCRVDAGHGFAFPAIRAGLEAAAGRVAETGNVCVALFNSHHAGVMGHHVEWAAERGLVALGFTNSPAAIAPWGGTKGLFGTNPIAFACPRPGSTPPLVIDASLSKVARGRIMVADQKGEPIPEGWALDCAGRPTTSAADALAGTMIPMGDAKGAALVLMVELLAAGLTGGLYGYEASSFFDDKGPPPSIGQLFIVMDPTALGGPGALARIETLMQAVLAQNGTRLPGERRVALREEARRDGIEIPDRLFADLVSRAGDRA